MALLTTSDAERKYGIPAETFAQLCRDGKIVANGGGGRPWRMQEEDVEEYLNKHPALRPPLPQPVPSGAELPNRRIWVILLAAGLILGIFAAVVGTLNDGFGVMEQLWPPTATPTPTTNPLPTSTPLAFATASVDENLILLAQFDVTTDDNNKPHVLIQRRIKEELSQLGEHNVRVELEPVILTSDDREKAEELGRRANASIVIWGEETGAQIIVNFLNIRQPDFEATNVKIVESKYVQIASVVNPAPYLTFITESLPGQISFLTLFALAQSYYANEDYPRATQILEQAVTLSTSNIALKTLSETYFRLGWLYQRPATYNPELAIQSYTQSIQADPNGAVAYHNRGNVYSKQGQWQLALSDYNKAIEIEPTFVIAYGNRGNLYSDQGQSQLAIQDYSKVIELDPALAAAYVNRGNVYFAQQQWQLAIQNYSKAIELNPTYVGAAYFGRGNVYSEQADYERAIQDFTKTIELAPTYFIAYSSRGDIYAKQGLWQLALDDYNKAIELDPTYIVAYGNRAGIYRTQGQWQLAVEDYTKIIELDPISAPAYAARGNVYVTQEQWQLALDDYNKVIELNPPYVAIIYQSRGDIYFAQEQWQLALENYNKAIELDPALADAYFYNSRGNVYFAQQQWQLAIQDYSKAIELDPTSFTHPYYYRGIAYGFIGDIDAASTDIQIVVNMLNQQNDSDLAARLEQCQTWLAQLEAGVNPFTPEILADLHNK